MFDNSKTPEQPSLSSERLVLRPMTIADAPMIHGYVSDKDVAYGCVNIPHPYPDGMAEAWISGHPQRFANQQAAIFAITKDEQIVGACGLEYKFFENHFEVGYWIGKPHWGNGYATEAIKTLLNYGMNTLGITEIYAEALAENTASDNVLRKVGMKLQAQIRRPCFPPYIQDNEVNIYKIQAPKLKRSDRRKSKKI